jgi:hypothetical protein
MTQTAIAEYWTAPKRVGQRVQYVHRFLEVSLVNREIRYARCGRYIAPSWTGHELPPANAVFCRICFPLCPQCGQPWRHEACGPTHALMARGSR